MNKKLILLQALTEAIEQVQDDVELRMIDFFKGIEANSIGLTFTFRVYGRTYCIQQSVSKDKCIPDNKHFIREMLHTKLQTVIEEAL